MQKLKILQDLARVGDTKLLLFVIDGVGGLPHPETGLTELETARTPHLDALVRRSSTGRTVPFGPGVGVGSGPGHLALFGYPIEQIALGRGVLEVLGAEKAYRDGEVLKNGYDLMPGDLTARGNFATVDPATMVVRDRRGGRPDDATSDALVRLMSRQVHIDDVEITLFPGKGHRFAVAFRGDGLTGPLRDTDPQQDNLPVIAPQGVDAPHARAVTVAKLFLRQAHEVLGASKAPNYALLRGIGTPPSLPSVSELFGLKAACVALYPMYRGVAQLVGMKVLAAHSPAEQVARVRENLAAFDFFFVHCKGPDAAGHLGDFDLKVREIEAADALVGQLAELPFDVIAVTGDHSTPTLVMDHTYHPVPAALWSKHCLVDDVERLSERAVVRGTLGTIAARDLLPAMLAEGGRMKRFGA
jgi:2,3-bisphosphoglycerate-independent phosphoglycerate mutase